MKRLSHLQSDGTAKMVDVGDKSATRRRAVVRGRLELRPEHQAALEAQPKGNAFAAASVAGILAGKRCAELIPLCHTVPLSRLHVDLRLNGSVIELEAIAEATAVTGVEMEAYTALVIAGVTLIDMLKSADPRLILTDVRLVEKTGGKSHFSASD